MTVPPVFLSTTAQAQGIVTGTVTGTVTDSSGAVVPNASIKATNLENGSSFTTTSQANGLFSLRNLSIGTYKLEITSSGFGTLTTPSVSVSVGNIVDLGTLKLSVASTQSVIVAASAAEVLTTSQVQTSASLDTLQLQSLPFNGGFDSVALLLPGVANTHSDNFSNTNGANFSSNGNRGRSNNFELDGQSNNDNSVGGPQVFFGNPDAIAEVQVVTNNFSAEYGRNLGSVVNYVTKSGTNAFHGTASEYYTGSFLSSLTNDQKSSTFGFCPPGVSPSTGCTVPSVPRTVDNKWGGTLGGPILKDKLWGFGSTFWEHTRDGVSPATSGSTVTPTPAGLATLASLFPGNPAVAALQANGPYSISAGNPRPAGASSIRAVTDGVTAGSVEFAPVERQVGALFNDQEELGRLDFQPTSKDHLFARYFYQNTLTTGPLANSNAVIARGGYIDVIDTAHSVGGDWSHTFSSAWVNQLRYSFQQTKLFFEGGAVPTCSGTDLTSCPTSLGLGGGYESFGYANNLPQGRTVKVTQVQDNANWTHGRHAITFGGEWDYQNSPNTFLPSFNGSYTYTSFNRFLSGTGTLTLGNGNPVIPFTEPDYALYFQDDWKVRTDLTLNLGLRWEFFNQAVNILNKETVARETGSSPFWNPSLPLSARTFASTPSFYKNFEPRLGFAWNPQGFAGGRFVLRGGYAINVDPAFYNIFLNAATSAPVINLGTIRCSAAQQCLPGNGVSGANVRTLNLPLLPTGGNPQARNQTIVSPNFRNPYGQTYTLGVQYQFGKVGALEARYVGTHVVGQFQSIDANPNLQAVATDFPNIVNPASLDQNPTDIGFGRPNGSEANVRTRANTAFSIYNSAQVQFRTSNFKGVTGSAAYTYSRNIDNVSEIFSTGGGGTTISFAANPLNNDTAERGVSGNDYPHLVSVGLNYQIPFFNQRSDLKGKLLGGFTFGAIYSYNSGQPYNPYQDLASNIGDTSYGDFAFNAAFIGLDSQRPILNNPKAPLGSAAIYVPASEASATSTNTPGYYVYNQFDSNGLLNQPTSANSAHWLWNNQAAAQLLNNPYPGVGRNTLRGQSFNNLDADVYKNFKVTERASIQLQFTAFNVLNRQYIGSPDANIDDFSPPGAGVNSFTSGAFETSNNRTVQLAAKIIF